MLIWPFEKEAAHPGHQIHRGSVRLHVEWPKAPGAESAAFQSEPQGAGVRFSKVDQVLWQFGKLVALYKGVDHMVVNLERWWAKMEQKLFLVAYALVANAAWSMHTASTLPATLQTCMSFFEAITEDRDKQFKKLADYFSSSGCFSLSLPSRQLCRP